MDEPFAELEALSESDVGRALVLDGERLVGLLSITDLTRALDLGSTRRPRVQEQGAGPAPADR